VIVLVLFGSTRLPKLARSMGQASKEFKKGVNEGDKDEERDKPATDKDKPAS
jgi:sec-independent protein translocase protein TatA